MNRTERNEVLLRCWAKIQHWIEENHKKTSAVIALNEKTSVEISNGEIAIDYRDATGIYSIRKGYFHAGVKRHRLSACIRKYSLPFDLIEVLVEKWDEVKRELNKDEMLFNFET